jgi:hypothetical protein
MEGKQDYKGQSDVLLRLTVDLGSFSWIFSGPRAPQLLRPTITSDLWMNIKSAGIYVKSRSLLLCSLSQSCAGI